MVVLDQRHSCLHSTLNNVEVADRLLVNSCPHPWLLSNCVPAVVVSCERIESSEDVPSGAKLSSSVEDEATDDMQPDIGADATAPETQTDAMDAGTTTDQTV